MPNNAIQRVVMFTMKIIQTILSFLFFLFAIPSLSLAELHFFNSDVLGKKITQKIILLESIDNKDHKLLEPVSLQVDNENGVFIAASIYYLAESISFKELVDSIDRKYPGTKHTNSGAHVSWRIEEKNFVISLAAEQEFGTFRVMYIRFRSLEQITQDMINVFKMKNDICKDNCK